MSSKSAVITTCIHKGTQADALIDMGCDLYALVDYDLACKLKVQIAECEIDNGNRLLFRDWIWVPGSEDPDSEANMLRTRIVQGIHDSVLSGYLGRDNTLALVSRWFYWPG